jgi:hypothetical protein
MVDVPLITTDEAICQSKDVVTPINTKISNIIMMTQVNHDKIKPRLRRINLLGYHINIQITEFVVCKNQHTNIPRYLIRVNDVLTYKSIIICMNLEVNNK